MVGSGLGTDGLIHMAREVHGVSLGVIHGGHRVGRLGDLVQNEGPHRDVERHQGIRGGDLLDAQSPVPKEGEEGVTVPICRKDGPGVDLVRGEGRLPRRPPVIVPVDADEGSPVTSLLEVQGDEGGDIQVGRRPVLETVTMVVV